MKIYFARAIRGIINVDPRPLHDILESFGTVLSEHFEDSKNASKDEQIYAQDMSMLADADVVVAEVSNPSLGVGYEIGHAEKLGKPVLCLAKEGEMVSAMIVPNPNLTFKRYSSLHEIPSLVKQFLEEKELLS